MRKIGIYCRVSTEEQAKNKEGSITSQIQRLKLKVEEKNRYENNKWGELVGIYKDEAFSGKNTDRPQYQKLLDDVRKNKIDTVMVTELSRLSRSVTDFLNFVQELEDLGADFICLQYDFDTTSPAGKVFMTIIMALAQFERELTAERIKNNFHARALRGLSNGGSPILGYDKDVSKSGSFIINKAEAEIVKDIFDLYLESSNIAEVVKILKEKGIKNKSWVGRSNKIHGGKEFNASAIWRMLSNYAYIGKREVNKSNKEEDQETLKFEDKYQIVDATWDAIISEETFNLVQQKLEQNKKVKYAVTYDFLLSGLLYCDECGKALCGQSGTGRNGKYFYYGHVGKTDCKIKRYSAEELEKIIKKSLFDLIGSKYLSEEFLDILSELTKSRDKSKKIKKKSLDAKIDATQKELDNLLTFIALNDSASSSKTIMAKVEQKESELAKLKEEETLLDNSEYIDDLAVVDSDYVLENLKKFKSDRFRKSKLSKRREIMRSVFKSIHINPENVLRVDLWGQSDANKASFIDSNDKGVVLPFYKAGRPLEASFRKTASRGDCFEEIKKATGIGTFVLDSSGFLINNGSYTVLNGRTDWI